MAAVTLALPTGEKVRTATRCRYALVRRYVGGEARVEKRSDDRAKLVKLAGTYGSDFASPNAREARDAIVLAFERGEITTEQRIKGFDALRRNSAIVPVAYVFDTHTGEVVR